LFNDTTSARLATQREETAKRFGSKNSQRCSEASMPFTTDPRRKSLGCALAMLLSLAMALPVPAYDSYLSEQAIRDAYFLGSREGGLTAEFLAPYSHWVRELRQGSCTTEIRLQTPFLQVADYTSKVPNYSSQDAVKAFHDKTMKFRIFVNICYKQEAPPPNSVKIKIIQNQRQIEPSSDIREFYAEPINELSDLPANGERARLEFEAQKIDSSELIIQIDTPDGQHSTTDVDLQTIR
jgi:hypothetical protein